MSLDKDDSLRIGTIVKGIEIKGSLAGALESSSAKMINSDLIDTKLHTATLMAYCKRELMNMPIESYLVVHHFMMFLLDNSGIVDMENVKTLREIS